MGKFGALMARDIYGNMNFERSGAIQMPKKKYTLESYEEEKLKEKEFRKKALDEGRSRTEHYLDILAK